MLLKRLFCWHSWVKQQEMVLLSIKAEHLLPILVVAFTILFFSTMLCSVPEGDGSPPVLKLGYAAWLVRAAFVAVIGYGIYALNVYNPDDLISLRAISDRTCYKCNKTVMAVTDRNVAIKNAEARLLAHRKTIQEVNDEMRRS